MKKLTVLCLAGLLVLALGAAGYAQDAPKLDFRASGFIDFQSHYTVNVPPLNPVGGGNSFATQGAIYSQNGGSWNPDYTSFNKDGTPARALDKKVSFWDSRMHLKFDMVMGKELSATLQFEIDAARWGSSETHGGNGLAYREGEGVGYWATDRTAMEVKYLYFDFALPYFGIPVPMSIRAGAQPLAIRPNFFVATDGSGLTGQIKAGNLGINPLYFKPLEGTDFAADDNDVYGLHLNYKVATFTLGGYGLWYKMGTYPMQQNTGFGVLNTPTFIGQQPFINGTQKGNFLWLGIYADGKAGPVNINFDFAYDWGKVWSTLSDSGVNPNVRYRGYSGRLKVDYPWERMNFGVTALYASGSDTERTSGSGLPGTLTSVGTPSTKVSGWMVPVGSEVGAVNSESAVFYGMEAGAMGGQGLAEYHNYLQSNKGSFGGTWFGKVYGSYKVTPQYKVTFQGLYIGDTTKNGNTLGTARDPSTGFATLKDNHTIGYEFDLMNEWQVYKNFTIKLFGGYLIAGKALDLYTGNAAVGNFSMKNPWAIRTRFMYTF